MDYSIKGPGFLNFFGPVLDALRALNASARPSEVYAWIEEHEPGIPQHLFEETTKSGQIKFQNAVSWARFYLVKAGYIGNEQHGIWTLTDKGRKAQLSADDAVQIFESVRDQFAKPSNEDASASTNSDDTNGENEGFVDDDDTAYFNEKDVREDLIASLRGMSNDGFEEFCALLLRQSGFKNVSVTQSSGDRGIDGEGYLAINRFIKTKVMFQSKRYEKTVGPDKIRDFRGALQGRAERGIFITTGTFTKAAIEEAQRENVTPIELIDIDGLLELLIEEEIGVAKVSALKIDREFFRGYSDK